MKDDFHAKQSAFRSIYRTQCVALFYAARLRINLAGLHQSLLLFVFKYLTGGKLAFEISILVSCVTFYRAAILITSSGLLHGFFHYTLPAQHRAEILIFMREKRKDGGVT